MDHSISFMPVLLKVAVVVVLPAILVMGLAFAAIKRKNWGGLAVLGIMTGALLLVGSLAVWTTGQRIVNDFDGIPDLEVLPAQALVTAPTPPQPPTAEVASDEELAAVASAPPKIDLSGPNLPAGRNSWQTLHDTGIDLSDPDLAAEISKTSDDDRPDWVDGDVPPTMRVLTVGPCLTIQSCNDLAAKALGDWVRSSLHERDRTFIMPVERKMSAGREVYEPPEIWNKLLEQYRSGFVKEEYTEKRAVSVGDVYLQHLLVANEGQPAWNEIVAELNEWKRQAQSRGHAALVSFAGAGVLSLVALAHVVLKSGGRKDKKIAP